MALLFVEGFDWTTAHQDLQYKWDGGTFEGMSDGPSLSAGRTGNALRLHQVWDSRRYYWVKSIPGQPQTVIVGLALYMNATENEDSENILIIESDGDVASIWVGNNRDLRLYVNGVLELSLSSHIQIGTWYYYELKVTVDNLAGAYEFKENNITLASDSGIDTQPGTQAYAEFVHLGYQYDCKGDLLFDDFYICDDSGSDNNDFLGPVRVQTALPDSVGNSSDWTPSSGGDNYADVDEATPDDDTTYVSSTNAGDVDLYGFAAIPTGNPILGVQVGLLGKDVDGVSRDTAAYVRSGTTEEAGSNDQFLGGYAKHILEIWEQDPDTAAAWTAAGVNGAEFGVKLVT